MDALQTLGQVLIYPPFLIVAAGSVAIICLAALGLHLGRNH